MKKACVEAQGLQKLSITHTWDGTGGCMLGNVCRGMVI